MSRIPSAAQPPKGTGYAFPAGVKVDTVRRPIDPETGMEIADTLAKLHAWAPINGDVAAATYAQENGQYVE